MAAYFCKLEHFEVLFAEEKCIATNGGTGEELYINSLRCSQQRNTIFWMYMGPLA